MDYEKKYKEALERAKEKRDEYKRLDGEESFVPSDIEYIFPELKESEDERIRREMIEIIKNEAHEFPSSVIANKSNSWIIWLEKQGERKNKINSYKITFEDVLALECAMKTAKITEGGNELYEMLVRLYNKIHNAYLFEKQGKQPYWKPSEEQLQTLHAQLNEGAVTYPEDKRILFTLYEDLMKIMTQEEKQGEQKPINECNTHEPTIDEAREWNEAYEKGYSLGYENGRNEQKPAWSEEDERHRKRIVERLEDIHKSKEDNIDVASVILSEINWLKSIKPQSKQECSEDDKLV